MYKFILLLLSIAASIYSSAQKVDLARFEKERVSKQKNGMIVLGGWSAANIIASGIAQAWGIGQRAGKRSITRL